MPLNKLREELYKRLHVDDVELFEQGTKIVAGLKGSNVNLDEIRKICLEHSCTSTISLSSDPQGTFIRFYCYSFDSSRKK